MDFQRNFQNNNNGTNNGNLMHSREEKMTKLKELKKYGYLSDKAFN